jgi:alginate O-acetyltransferase complex protein AlgI
VYLNLVTVFFLCGLWHGANWTFVVWGLYHGSFLVIERLGLGAALAHCPRPLRHGYTLLAVMVGWVFFRADTLTDAIGIVRALTGAGPGHPTAYAVSWYLTPEVLLAAVAGVVGSTPIWPWLAEWLASRGTDEEPRLGAGASAFATLALSLVFGGCLMLIAAHTYNPFIYFRF